jgi:hypothetical protein
MTKLFALDDCKEINRSARSKRLAKTVMDPETPRLTQQQWPEMYDRLSTAFHHVLAENEHLRMQLIFYADARRPQ